MVITGKSIDVAVRRAGHIIQTLEHVGHGGEDLGEGLHLNLNLDNACGVTGLHAVFGGEQSRIGRRYSRGHSAQGFVEIHHTAQAGARLKSC